MTAAFQHDPPPDVFEVLFILAIIVLFAGKCGGLW